MGRFIVVVILYTSDHFVNPFGCVHQHQFCNPVNYKCTELDSYPTAVRSAQRGLQFDTMQYYTVSVLSIDLYFSIISQSESLSPPDRPMPFSGICFWLELPEVEVAQLSGCSRSCLSSFRVRCPKTNGTKRYDRYFNIFTHLIISYDCSGWALIFWLLQSWLNAVSLGLET